MKSSERSVSELFDRQDMLEVMYRYCRSADVGDAGLMVACFTEDCTVSLFADEARVIRGSQALHDLLSPLLGKVLAGSHYITNPEFTEYAADQAVLHCYMFSSQRFHADMALPDRLRWGRYEVRFRKGEDGWRISDLRLFAVSESGGDRQGETDGRVWPPSFPS